MCKIVNLKIQLDVFRDALDIELISDQGDGCIKRVRQIYDLLKETESQLHASWSNTSEDLLN